MNTFEITYITKKVLGKEKIKCTITDFIPVGRSNAIKRDNLVALCLVNDLISPEEKDPDRAMRRLLNRARIDYTILNLSNGCGYYKPSKDDLDDLQKYINQEDRRARSSFKNHAMAKKLYEDFIHDRLEVEQDGRNKMDKNCDRTFF